MFDVGFSELVVIGIVALIVVGPQRLPTVARTVGHLLGRLQRYVGDVKADIRREMQLDELKKLQEEVSAQARDMEQQVNTRMSAIEDDLNRSIAGGIAAKADATAGIAPASANPAEVERIAAASATPAGQGEAATGSTSAPAVTTPTDRATT